VACSDGSPLDPAPYPTAASTTSSPTATRLSRRGSLYEGDNPPPPAWTTYVRVEDADAATRRATAAGARVLVEPFDVGPPGRLAVIEDPVGAAFAVWQAGAREGAGLVNETGAWAMSTLLTTESERAHAFYGELFGWRFDTSFGDGIWLCRLPGYVGGEEQQPVLARRRRRNRRGRDARSSPTRPARRSR